jgi:hypothetical protein
MSSIIYDSVCYCCGKRFDYVMPLTICMECNYKESQKLSFNPFMAKTWQQKLLQINQNTQEKVNTNLEPCEHKDTSIVVIQANQVCEETAIQCDYCGEILTKPKTDCR